MNTPGTPLIEDDDLRPAVPLLTGTANQIELAEQIRARAGEEFDRVVQALGVASSRQSDSERAATHAVIAIIRKKRAAITAQDRAGYFIQEWQNLDGRVRQLLSMDAEYLKIQATRREARVDTCQ
jgi:hypothetical protein